MPQLKDLLVQQLQDLLSAETQIVRALPKMAEAAENPKLKEGLEKHLTQTETHVERLKQSLELLGGKAGSEPCRGMQGILEEGEEVLEKSEDMDELAADLALIGASQKVEHYEISGYCSAKCLAKQIGENEIAKLLSRTLGEEEAADFLLTSLAKPIMEQATSQEYGNGTKMPWGEPGDPSMRSGQSDGGSTTRSFAAGAGAGASQPQAKTPAQAPKAGQSEQPRGSAGRPAASSGKASFGKTSAKGRS